MKNIINKLKNNNNLAISMAGLALALDIITFIILSFIIFKITNTILIIMIGALIYILGYDAWRATEFIINYFKNNN